jgi:malyl-CoA/(S)-citramalyl-CoA lyase
VPGSQPQLFEKAARSAADVIFLDLEDAVAPDDKPQARKNIIQALNDIDWGNKIMSVRINGLDTHFMYRDVVDVVEQAAQAARPDHDPQGRHRGRRLCRRHDGDPDRAGQGLTKKIGLELIIETASACRMSKRSPAASKRNESLHFGVADYAASTKARTTNIGGANPDYAVLTDKDEGIARRPLGRHVALRHRPHGGGGPRQRHASDRRAVRRFLRCRRLQGGYRLRGQMGDPSFAALANEVLPVEARCKKAHRILEAMAEAQREGRGAVAL